MYGCLKIATVKEPRLWALIFLLAVGSLVPAFGQSSSTDQIEALIKDVPQLPFDQVVLNVKPPLGLERVSAVTTDKKGNIYLMQRSVNGDPVVEVDAQGNFIRSWGKGMFTIPHGIRVDPDGNVWTLDAHTSMIYKFTPEGKKLLEISVGDIPDSSKKFCGATDIAFGKRGHLFVADGYCNARVIEYDAAGKKLREWGKHGNGPGEFYVVHSIAISRKGILYVADRENGRVQRFDKRGKFLGEWTYGGQLYAVAFGPNEEFYATIHAKGVAFDKEFYVMRLDLASGRILGKFMASAHELAVAPNGTLLPSALNDQLILLKPRK